MPGHRAAACRARSPALAPDPVSTFSSNTTAASVAPAGNYLAVSWGVFRRPRPATRRVPQQPRARATWDNIVEAAKRALDREGPDVTMTRIAEVAGYGIGTVYQYFPERTSLMCELMHRQAESNAAAVAELLPAFQRGPIEKGVRSIVELLVSRMWGNRQLVALVLREILPTLPPDDVEDLLPQFATLLAAQLRAKGNTIRECDLELAATIILQSAEAVLHRAVLEDPERLDDPVLVDELTTLIVGYLRG